MQWDTEVRTLKAEASAHMSEGSVSAYTELRAQLRATLQTQHLKHNEGKYPTFGNSPES